MKCPNCNGTGQIPFQIPVWHNGEQPVSFVEATSKQPNDEVHQIGHDFGKFIKANVHGCFCDGLKAELNRD